MQRIWRILLVLALMGGICLRPPAPSVQAGVEPYSLLAFDALGSKDFSGSNSATQSFTVGSGIHRILIVTIVFSVDGNFFSTVTWNGTNLTKITSGNPVACGVEIWYLLDPSSGTANVVATTTGGSGGPRAMGIMSFSGAVGIAPGGTVAGSTSTSASTAPTATNSSGDIVIGVVGAASGASTLTITAGASIYNGTQTGSGSQVSAAGYLATTDTTGAPTWTLGSSAGWSLATARIHPYNQSSEFFQRAKE